VISVHQGALVQGLLRRVFRRGGARRRGGAAAPRTVATSSPARPCLPLNTAPWYVSRGVNLWWFGPDWDVRELQDFGCLEVWDRFKQVFPVLAVYRAGCSGRHHHHRFCCLPGMVADSTVCTVPVELGQTRVGSRYTRVTRIWTNGVGSGSPEQ
jgi:hypothetical protein